MSGLIDLIIPREKKFFELLYKQIKILESSVNSLNSFPEGKFTSEMLKKALSEARNYEIESSKIYMEVIDSLHKTFITPIDRDEIKDISRKIHKAVNGIKKINATLYYLENIKFDEYLKKQIVILKDITDILEVAFQKPLSLKDNKVILQKIAPMENQADEIHDDAIKDLFKNTKDAVVIMRQKELYEVVEKAIDRVNHISDTLETILINNS